jgi:hypothetical protein
MASLASDPPGNIQEKLSSAEMDNIALPAAREYVTIVKLLGISWPTCLAGDLHFRLGVHI